MLILPDSAGARIDFSAYNSNDGRSFLPSIEDLDNNIYTREQVSRKFGGSLEYISKSLEVFALFNHGDPSIRQR
jgi:hypothetical protein